MNQVFHRTKDEGSALSKIIIRSMFVVFVAICMCSGFYIIFYIKYLDSYTWSEFLINYEGGFIRRGLLGEIAYMLHQYVPLKISFAVLVGAPYVVFCILMFKFFRYVPLQWQVYYIFCPALFSFWIWDSDVFGRKDIYGMVLFVCLILLSLNEKKVSLYRSKPILFYACLNFGILIASLIHEIIIFFIPFFMIVTNSMYSNQKGRKFIVLNLLTLVSVPAVVFVTGFLIERKVQARLLVENSWKEMFELTRHTISRSLDFLYMNMSDGINISLNIFFTYPTNVHYLGLFIIMSLPFLLLGWFKRVTFLNFLRLNVMILLNFFLCLTVPFGLFFVGMDYGRWINQILTYLYFLFGFILATQEGQANGFDNIESLRSDRPAFLYDFMKWATACLFLTIFMLIGVKHYVDAGSTPIILGDKSPYFEFFATIKDCIVLFFEHHPSILRLLGV